MAINLLQPGCDEMTRLKFCLLPLWLACAAFAEPVLVHHVRGYVHGFLLVKDTGGKIVAAGDVIQRPAGSRLTNTMTLHFRDGSLYQETTVFLQQRTFQLLSYRLVQKGPSFKTPEIFSFDTTTGNISMEYTGKKDKDKNISEHLDMPPDLANGMIPTLLTETDPKVETTLSMLVSTPKPRLVRLKISAVEPDPFSVAGIAAKATHYVIKIDIGGVTGAVAKVVGKQPPPQHVWVAEGSAPIFLRSESELYEDGPVWCIELTSPRWTQDLPKN
jgi:hypothetical protein